MPAGVQAELLVPREAAGCSPLPRAMEQQRCRCWGRQGARAPPPVVLSLCPALPLAMLAAPRNGSALALGRLVGTRTLKASAPCKFGIYGRAAKACRSPSEAAGGFWLGLRLQRCWRASCWVASAAACLPLQALEQWKMLLNLDVVEDILQRKNEKDLPLGEQADPPRCGWQESSGCSCKGPCFAALFPPYLS